MLKLGTVRKSLWNHGSSVPYSTASASDISAFDFKVNQVCERFFTLGTWRACWKRPTLVIYGDRLTLPRGFDTCRGAELSDDSCHPFQLYSEFHTFAASGGYFYDPSYYGWSWLGTCASRPLTLINDNAQTFVIPTGTYIIRCVGSEVANPGLTLTGGFDENGDEILGEVSLPVAIGTRETIQQYTELPEFTKVSTTYAVNIYSVDTTTLVATLIAVYAPGETVPTYRQYSIGSTALDGKSVRTISKLGFEPAIAENDLVIPGNLGALKLGLQALQFEDKIDPANAGIYWGPNYSAGVNRTQLRTMAGAIDLLDSEIAELDAAEQPVFNVQQDYAAGSVTNVT